MNAHHIIINHKRERDAIFLNLEILE